MNRDAVLIRAVADIVKERLGSRVKTIDTITNQITPPDFGPLTEALDRFAAREIPSPQVSIDGFGPLTEAIERFAAREMKMDAPVINVTVDMTPVAEAIEKQTDSLEKMFGKLLKAMEKDKEIEIIKDSAGKITGARRK